MNVKIIGRAVVITADIKSEVIDQLKKFEPTALKLNDENGNVYFAIGNDRIGGISKNGVSFNDRNPAGDACITITIPESVPTAQREAYVTGDLSPVFYNLKIAEEQANAAYAELKERFDSVAESITCE
jgi:hypothetical protein